MWQNVYRSATEGVLRLVVFVFCLVAKEKQWMTYRTYALIKMNGIDKLASVID